MPSGVGAGFRLLGSDEDLADLAQARLTRVRAALGSIRVGWAGSLKPREPHYFRIEGASFLIEFDNSGGNPRALGLA